MTHRAKMLGTGELVCSKCFHDWPCPEYVHVPDVDHDPLCPYFDNIVSSSFCGWCKIARQVRVDERKRLDSAFPGIFAMARND